MTIGREVSRNGVFLCGKPTGEEFTDNNNNNNQIISDKKDEHRDKPLGADTFCWGGDLPCEGVGVKKFGMSLETQGKQTLSRDIQGYSLEYPGDSGCPKRSRTECFHLQLLEKQFMARAS